MMVLSCESCVRDISDNSVPEADNIMIIGPFDSSGSLYYNYSQLPKEYHVASMEEMECIIKEHRCVDFPVYTSVNSCVIGLPVISGFVVIDENTIVPVILGTSDVQIIPGYLYIIKDKL